MNDMGDPLDHGFDEADPEGNTTQGDMPVAGPSCVHAAVGNSPSELDITEVERGGVTEVRSMSWLTPAH